jgi:hypothetical protein
VSVLAHSSWKISHQRLINQSDDSGNFVSKSGEGLLPLYEGKYFHHYDHRWVTNAGNDDRALSDTERRDPNCLVRPRYWYPLNDLRSRFGVSWNRTWILAWRDITNATNERSLIAAVLPSVAVPNTARVLLVEDAHLHLLPALVANLGAFALDFVARQKIGGMHMSGFIVDQLAVIAPETYGVRHAWVSGGLSAWLTHRVLELTYTTWDLEPFAHDVGYDGPPFRWDPERRFLLRCELDATFFRLYGLSRDETDYVMETFSIVRKHDEKTHGCYRTKDKILEIYDAMADAVRTSKPYQTALDPPPADLRVAHPRQDANVIPLTLPARTRPPVQPAVAALAIPDLSAVGANDWGRPHSDESNEVSAAIIAVLRVYGAPVEQGQVRLAALLCLEPHLLVPHLEASERSNWMRVVGADTQKASDAPIDGTSQPWGAAIRKLRARGKIVEDGQLRTWGLGEDTSSIVTRGWPDWRAGFVVNVLRRLQTSVNSDAIITKFPDLIREWLKHAA